MAKIFIKHAQVVATMNDQRLEIEDGAILTEGRIIKAVGTTEELAKQVASESDVQHIDASGCVVMPGLINCHHHFYGSTCRGYITSRGVDLESLVKDFSPIWSGLSNEMVYYASKALLCEYVLSGGTTVVNHDLAFVNDCRLDSSIRAANELGVRIHAVRGGMDRTVSKGGILPEDTPWVTSLDEWLGDCKRLLETYHDASDLSMTRICLGPATLFNATKEMYSASVKLARSYKNVGLHTHMSESPFDTNFVKDVHGCRPLEVMEEVGFVGPDVWFAHTVHLRDDEIKRMRELGCGASHNPQSNMTLGSGIARVTDMRKGGVKVGLGTDGCQCGDSNHMLSQARLAMLLQRVNQTADQFPARHALEIATRGGAAVLGRESHLGSLEVGKAADIVAYRVDGLRHSGAQGDVVGALIACEPVDAWLNIINGKVLVQNGELLGVDIKSLVKKVNDTGLHLLQRAHNNGWEGLSRL